MSQKPTYAQQSTAKIAPTVSSTLVQDPQSLANHNDLTQHFVTNGPSSAQFAQPVFIPTSSGLLLTAALPTMLTSHISNLQPITQSPMSAATLHSMNGGEKSSPPRPCINMQIPHQPTLAVTLPPDNNMQPSFLPNNFAFGMNAAGAAVPLNQAIVGDKTTQTLPQPPSGFNRTTGFNQLTSVTLSQPFNHSQKIATTTPNTLSLPVTFSLSAPPPLCVQSQSSNHHLNLSNQQISFTSTNNTNNSMATQLSNDNGNIMSKVKYTETETRFFSFPK